MRCPKCSGFLYSRFGEVSCLICGARPFQPRLMVQVEPQKPSHLCTYRINCQEPKVPYRSYCMKHLAYDKQRVQTYQAKVKAMRVTA